MAREGWCSTRRHIRRRRPQPGFDSVDSGGRAHNTTHWIRAANLAGCDVERYRLDWIMTEGLWGASFWIARGGKSHVPSRSMVMPYCAFSPSVQVLRPLQRTRAREKARPDVKPGTSVSDAVVRILGRIRGVFRRVCMRGHESWDDLKAPALQRHFEINLMP